MSPNPHPESRSYIKPAIPPIGLMYLAAVLEKEGYKVKIINAVLPKLKQIELSEKIISYNPDIVGITSDSLNFFESLRVAKIVKTVTNALVVLGGPHTTIRANEVIKYPEIDVAVIGEGEYTLLEIVQRIEQGKDLEGCKGCIVKIDNRVITNPPRELIEDLDSLPFPARHLLPFQKYPRRYTFGGLTPPIDTLLTSRGCPYNCSFCSSRVIWGSKYRFRSPEKVVDEIEHLINKYGTKSIYFREDNFTLNKKRVIGICNELRRRKIDIEWECSSRVDLVDKHLLGNMIQSGCKSIWYGIESGSPKTLKKINKGITIEKSREAVKITREVGLNVGGSFMIGIPGENMADINKTINFIKELKLKPSALAYFMAIPDSQLFYEVKENHLYDSSYSDILFVKTSEFDKNSLSKIILKVNKELRFLWQIENLKNDFLSTFTKYTFRSLRHPKKALNFLKRLKTQLTKSK